MTSEVIDMTHPSASAVGTTSDLEDAMTAVTAPALRTTEDRLRTVLRADSVVTGAVGLFALLAPASTYGDVPGWLPRVVGVLLLAVAVYLVFLARLSGSRLRLAGIVTADLALAWVIATVPVLALVDLSSPGREV